MTHDTLKALDEIEASLDYLRAPTANMPWEAAHLAKVFSLLPTLRAALTQPAAVEDGELRRLTDVEVCGGCHGEGHVCDGLDEDACSYPCPQCNGHCWVVGSETVQTINSLRAAVNALPGLMAERDRMKEALEFYAWQEHWEREPHEISVAAYDHGKRARAGLGGKP